MVKYDYNNDLIQIVSLSFSSDRLKYIQPQRTQEIKVEILFTGVWKSRHTIIFHAYLRTRSSYRLVDEIMEIALNKYELNEPGLHEFIKSS